MVDETGETSGVSSKFKRFLNEAPFFCKILQFLLCVISIGLIVDPFKDRMQDNFDHAGLVYIAVGGFIIINTIHIVCYLYGERVGKRTSSLFSRVGAILCFAAGVVTIYDWKNYQSNLISRYQDQYLRQMLASGIFAIMASVVFVVELYFVTKDEE